MISKEKEEEKEENKQYQQNRKTFKNIIMAFITKFIIVKKLFIGVLTYV
jgi:TRAP-type C4-dicarboxylate transport system permease large subunit